MKNIYLEKCYFDNYRNFENLSLDFAEQVNIIVGPNGSGKTNILEAISLLSPGKGLKSSNYDEICRYGHAKWLTRFKLNSKLGIAEINMEFNNAEKSRKIDYNGSKISSAELPNLINPIWVTPQIDGIFLGGASIRRKFLDRIVYNFNPIHAKRLSKYDYFIRERNKILAHGGWEGQGAWLSTIEEKIVEEGILIETNRQKAVSSMQKAIDELETDFPKAILSLSKLFDGQYDLSNIAQVYVESLKNNRKKDSYAGRAALGVHRSDFIVVHSEKGCKAKYCSTGEQKAMLITLILASVESIIKNTDCTPVLLLDELFIHLDPNRKNQLAEYINFTKLQTFITSTDMLGIEYLAKKSNIINL